MCPKKHFGLQKFYSNKIFWKRFRILSKNYSDFWRAHFGHNFQDCSYVSIAMSSIKTYFFEKKYNFYSMSSSVSRRNVFKFLANIWAQNWQKSFLCPKEQFMENKFIEKKLNNVYGFWAISFWYWATRINIVAKTAKYVIMC